MRFMLPALYQSWCVEGGIHIIFLVDTKNKTKTKDKSFSFFFKHTQLSRSLLTANAAQQLYP